MNAKGNKITAFTLESSLTFNTAEKSTHIRKFRLCNPYDCRIYFKIQTNASGRYSIKDSSGSLDPRNCIDIEVTYLLPVPPKPITINASDKLRILVGLNNLEFLDCKELELIVEKFAVKPTEPTEPPQLIPESSKSSIANSPNRASPKQNDNNWYLFVRKNCLFFVIAWFALLALLYFPTVCEYDPDSSKSPLPEMFHLSIYTHKLVAVCFGVVSILLLIIII